MQRQGYTVAESTGRDSVSKRFHFYKMSNIILSAHVINDSSLVQFTQYHDEDIIISLPMKSLMWMQSRIEHSLSPAPPVDEANETCPSARLDKPTVQICPRICMYGWEWHRRVLRLWLLLWWEECCLVGQTARNWEHLQGPPPHRVARSQYWRPEAAL